MADSIDTNLASLSATPNEGLARYLSAFTDELIELEERYRSTGLRWHELHPSVRSSPELDSTTSPAARAARSLFEPAAAPRLVGAPRDVSWDAELHLHDARRAVRRGHWVQARTYTALAVERLQRSRARLAAADEAISVGREAARHLRLPAASAEVAYHACNLFYARTLTLPEVYRRVVHDGATVAEVAVGFFRGPEGPFQPRWWPSNPFDGPRPASPDTVFGNPPSSTAEDGLFGEIFPANQGIFGAIGTAPDYEGGFAGGPVLDEQDGLFRGDLAIRGAARRHRTRSPLGFGNGRRYDGPEFRLGADGPNFRGRDQRFNPGPSDGGFPDGGYF